MDFQVILSGKEKIQILHRGFRLRLQKGPVGPKNSSYYVCVERGCKARAGAVGELTKENLSLTYHHVEQHNHHADESKNVVAEKLYLFRKEAKEKPDKTAKSIYEKLVSEAINAVSTPDKNALAVQLPKFEKVKDQHYRQRKKLRPKLPKTIDEVDIPSYTGLTTTERGHPFYRGKCNSGAEIFFSDAQMEIGCEADTLFIDGTFSICPEPFYQIVFMRAKVGTDRYTIATALLPNKQEKTYTEMLKCIAKTYEENGKTFDFVFVHCDCEQGLINAIQSVIISAEVKLCRFHVVDAIRRHGNSHGLRQAMKQFPDFKRFYGRVRQIFFYPPKVWPKIWNVLVEQMTPEAKCHPDINHFLDYLVRTNIE